MTPVRLFVQTLNSMALQAINRVLATGFLLFFASFAAKTECSSCPTLNFVLDMPVGYFAGYEMTSSTAEFNTRAQYVRASFLGAVEMNNLLNAAGTPPVIGTLPMSNVTFHWQGQCYTSNVQPVYRAVLADMVDEANIQEAVMLAESLCRNDAFSPPQVVTAVDGTITNPLLFSAESLVCNSYNVSTIHGLTSEIAFSDKANYPLTARATPELELPNAVFFRLLQRYNWNRVAVLADDSGQTADELIFIRNLADQNDRSLYVQVVNAGLTDCSALIENIVANQLKIIFILGAAFYHILCLEEIIVRRQLLTQNYILTLSFETTGTIGFSLAALATFLNISPAQIKGVFALNAIVSTDARTFACINAVAEQYAIFGFSPSVIPLLDVQHLLACDATILANQGVSGMLGQRIQAALTTFASNTSDGSSGGDPSTFGSQAALQNASVAFLNELSLSGKVDTNALNFSAFSANVSITVSVPFQAMRYPTSDVFSWFINASAASMHSVMFGNLVHNDNGDPIARTSLLNFDGSTECTLAEYDLVYNTYTEVSNAVVAWPNNSLLSQFANQIPGDRFPTLNAALQCQTCATALRSIDIESTLYSKVPNLRDASQLDLSLETPAVYTIAAICDGTAPVRLQLLPPLAGLASDDSSLNATTLNAPILVQSASRTVTVYSAAFISAIKQLYESSPSSFSAAGQQPAVSSVSSAAALINPAAVIGVVDSATAAFYVELLVVCDNGANNASAAFRLSILGEADVFSPSAAAQDALFALNALGLVSVCAVALIVIRNRRERVIFSSSFIFLLVILLGFALLFVSSLLSVSTASTSVCQAKLITFHLGFTLALGALFVKTYRLHRIFNSKKLLTLNLSNSSLLGAVLVLLLVDAVILICWIETSGFSIESISKPHCYTAGNGAVAFPVVFSVTKGVILLLGTYLTFRVRSVVANFNESRFIAFVIYNTTVLSIVYIVVFFAFSLQPNSLAIATSFIIFAGALLNLLCFFLPKVLALKTIFMKNDSSSHAKGFTTGKHKSAVTGNRTSRGSSAASTQKDGIGLTKSDELPTADGKQEEKGRGGGVVNVEQRARAALMKIRELKLLYLAAIQSNVKGQTELSQLEHRMEDVKKALVQNFDELQTHSLDIRLQSERIKSLVSKHFQQYSKQQSSGTSGFAHWLRHRGIGSVTGSDPAASSAARTEVERLVQDCEGVVLAVSHLVKLPIDLVEVNETGDNYRELKSPRRSTARAASLFTGFSVLNRAGRRTGNTDNASTVRSGKDATNANEALNQGVFDRRRSMVSIPMSAVVNDKIEANKKEKTDEEGSTILPVSEASVNVHVTESRMH